MTVKSKPRIIYIQTFFEHVHYILGLALFSPTYEYQNTNIFGENNARRYFHQVHYTKFLQCCWVVQLMMRGQISNFTNFHQVGEHRWERGIAHVALKKNGKKTGN